MRFSRSLVGLFAAVLPLALIGLAPAQAVAPAADPLATTVTGACYGGPGRLSLTVHPPAADGTYQVEATARRLVEGTRWVVRLDEEGAGGREKEFRRRAVDGSWTVVTEFPSPAPNDGEEVLFQVSANERGAPRHGCFLLASPASPVGGLSACSKKTDALIVLVAKELDDGSTLVRSLIFGVPSESRWHFKLTAIGAASHKVVVEFDDQAKRYGVRSRVVIAGVQDPRLRMVATSENGGSCFIGLDPANVTTSSDAPLRLDGLAGQRRLLDRDPGTSPAG